MCSYVQLIYNLCTPIDASYSPLYTFISTSIHLIYNYIHLIYTFYRTYIHIFSYMHLVFKQQKTFSVFAQPDINTRGVGRIRDSYANPRRSLGFKKGLHNRREFSQRLECLYQAMQTQEKSFLLLLYNNFPEKKNAKLFVWN